MGPDGNPRCVLAVERGTSELYTIKPVKGEPFTVTGDHLLSLIKTNECKGKDSDEIIDISVKDWIASSCTFKHTHKLFRSSGIIAFAGSANEFVLDPYFLGILLGDGCFRYSNINITTPDSEVVEEIVRQAKLMGAKLRTEPAGKAKTYFFSFQRKYGRLGTPFVNKLKQLGLHGHFSGEKFVPEAYKTAGIKERLEMIAGLIDSDGTKTYGGYDYISKSKQLAEDLAFMCRSVGLAAYIKQCVKRCKDYSGTYYRVSISGDCSIIPCRVARKKQKPRKQKKSVLRTGFKVEPAGIGQYIGFTVDEDNRYLLDDFTVTHNCGKTICFSEIAQHKVELGERVLILAHRDELIEQARDKYKMVTGYEAGKEKASETSIGSDLPVIVGSVQTMCRPARLERFAHDHFSTIIVDEAHHCPSTSYRSVLDWFPEADLLGVTATPDRADRKSLATCFDAIAYEYSLRDAIRDGYLCRIQAQMIPLTIDMSNVKVSVGDYEVNSVADAIDPYLEEIAQKIKEYASDRKTIVFLPLVATSQRFCGMLQSIGVDAREVNGESQDRKEVLEWFDRAGPGTVLCNAMLLCLDMETEILTSRGFLGPDELTDEDEVANWNFDGSVFFEKPKEIVRRELEPTEHMVSIDSRRVNLRVTNTHRMIVGCGKSRKNWKKISAQDLSNRHVLPSCGVAQPINLKVKQEDRRHSKHAISSTVYQLTQKGMPRAEARKEAERRAKRDESLKYKDPAELTLDECRFIGFWVADGSKCKLASGGVEYTLAQSQRYGIICDWIEKTIKNCNLDYLKREYPPSTKSSFNSYRWSLPRGTGSGVQQRNGVYPIEPYLCKDGSALWWGLNEQQFDALLEGFWYGDGFHGTAECGFPKSVKVTNTNKMLIDLLCAIGSVRGWNCSVSVIPMRNPKHSIQYGLRMIKGQKICLSSKTQIIHEDFAPETVWCVRTTSKNIITRRHGKVTVMGNTEGWDCPSVDCIVMLRPTKSRALYTQCIGRGTRISPGKENLLLLDFLWMSQKHNLCRPASLFATNEEDEKAIVKRMEKDDEPIDMMGAASDAEESRMQHLAEQLRANARRKSKLINPLDWAVSIDAADLADYEPTFQWEFDPISDKQRKVLEDNGFDTFGMTKGYASQILDRLFARSKMELTSPKQIKALEKRGYQQVGKWPRKLASAMLDAWAKAEWKPWKVKPSIRPEVFEWTKYL